MVYLEKVEIVSVVNASLPLNLLVVKNNFEYLFVDLLVHLYLVQ